MSSTLKISLFFLCCLVPAVISNTNLQVISPQIIAIISLIITVFSLKYKYIPSFFITLVVQMIVFSTGALLSPLLFLEYFLLFSLSFEEQPRNILIYSLLLSIVMSQFLVSFSSLINLISFLFISPLAYLLTKKLETNQLIKKDTLLFLTLQNKQKSQDATSLITELKNDN